MDACFFHYKRNIIEYDKIQLLIKGSENMQVNRECTIKYYENYSPCNCGDCRNFIHHIETEQPAICDYLKSLNINPLKPFELRSIYHEKDKKIEYLDCAYIVIGSNEKEIEKVINGIKVITCSKERYPLEDMEEDYFLITFGPIYMRYSCPSYRHFTFNDKVNIIKKSIDEADPMELLSLHCPKDEYMNEAILIAKEAKKKKNNYINGKMIQKVFKKQFNETISMKVCSNIAKKINMDLDMKDFIKSFEENDLLKGKIINEGNQIILKLHEHFIISNVERKTYINGKFYYNIDDHDLLYSFCNFVKDDDTIYIQYKHKHGCFYFNHSRYFKKIKRSKFFGWKLKHKKDIELIFDNKGVIYFGKINNLPEKDVIELMFKEPVKEKYEKLFYSPDKRKRLIVELNHAGSYSYYIEKLIILNIDEIGVYRRRAFWEPQFGTYNASFYENIELLLKDISVEIKDWIEVK